MTLRVSKVAEGVHRLEDVYTNWYLLDEGGRLTVLGAGLRADWPQFVSALARLGHSPAGVDAAMITHHHRDDTGNARRLRWSGARVLSHPADAPQDVGEIPRPPQAIAGS